MVVVVIDNISYVVKEGLSLLEVCKFAGIFLPRFCYHESLSIAGNCRMCLIRIQDTTDFIEKNDINNIEDDEDVLLTVACSKELSENDLNIITNDVIVKKARENVLEFLLLPSGSAGSTLVAASKNSIDVIQGQQTPNHNFANPRHPSSDIVTENTLAGLGLGVMTNDIFLIVGIVCGILGLGLVILITIK